MTIVGRLFWASFFDGVMKFLLALEIVLKGRAGVAYGRPMVVFLEGVVGLVCVLFLRAEGARKNGAFSAFLSLSGCSRYRFWTQLAEIYRLVQFRPSADRLVASLASSSRPSQPEVNRPPF